MGNSFTLLSDSHVGQNTTCLHRGKMHVQYAAVMTTDIVIHWVDATLVLSAVILSMTNIPLSDF